MLKQCGLLYLRHVAFSILYLSTKLGEFRCRLSAKTNFIAIENRIGLDTNALGLERK